VSNSEIPIIYRGDSVKAHAEKESSRPVYISLGIAGHYLSVEQALKLSSELAAAATAARGT